MSEDFSKSPYRAIFFTIVDLPASSESSTRRSLPTRAPSMCSIRRGALLITSACWPALWEKAASPT